MHPVHRRTLLRAGLAAAAAGTLAACSSDDKTTVAGFVPPDGDEVRDAEARRKPGAVREFQITASPGSLDLGGLTVQSWAYGGAAPGKEIRVKAGEVVRATLVNQLPQETSVHWHGLALRNNADGVPGGHPAPDRCRR